MPDQKYNPIPIDISDAVLDEKLYVLIEAMAKNFHDIWAKNRMEQGWTYGPQRDDDKKQNPCLVEYEALPEHEKLYDYETAMATLKFIVKMGYSIVKNASFQH